jgi:hypothetical protein
MDEGSKQDIPWTYTVVVETDQISRRSTAALQPRDSLVLGWYICAWCQHMHHRGCQGREGSNWTGVNDC